MQTGMSFNDVLWLCAHWLFFLGYSQSSCPTGAKLYTTLNLCYWVHPVPAVFSNANTNCGTKGGVLAVIPDSDAKQFIEDNLATELGSVGAWIGVKTTDFVNFEYTDGTRVTYLPWKTLYNANGQCVYLTTSSSPYAYNDLDCGNFKQSLCYLDLGSIGTRTQTPSTTTQPKTTTIQQSTNNTQQITTTTHEKSTTTQPPSTTTQLSTNTTQPYLTTTQPDRTTTQSHITTTQLPATTTQPHNATSTQQSTSGVQPSTITTSGIGTTSVIHVAATSELTTIESTNGQTTQAAVSTESMTTGSIATIKQSQTSTIQQPTATQTTESTTTASSNGQTTQAAVSTESSTKATDNGNDTCVCVCYGNRGNISEEELKIRLKKLVTILTVPKKTTSASLRKLISAPDNRISAKGIGYFGAAILISVFGLIVLTDITNIFMERQNKRDREQL